MALKGNYRGNIANLGEGMLLFVTWFLCCLFFSIFALGVRAVQFNGPIPGFEFGVSVVTAAAFGAAMLMSMKATGGYIYHMHLVATLIVGSIVHWITDKPTRVKLYKNANPEWYRLDWSRALVASLAMLIAFFVAPFIIWLFAGDQVVFIPHSPGSWPGFNTLANPWFAFAAEAVSSALLGWALTYFALTGYNPSAASGHAHTGYKYGIIVSSFLLIGVIWLSFNISGSCFDLALWTASHLMVGILRGAGFTVFDPVPYGDFGTYWFVYVFGAMVGWVIGVSFGYISKAIDTVDYEESAKEAGDAEESEGEEMLPKEPTSQRQIGSRSNRKSASQQHLTVDQIAGTLFNGE